MHRRAQTPHFPRLAAALYFLAATLSSSAQAQSLCGDYHVPAGHIGNVQSCVTTGNTTTITFKAPAILLWDRGFNIGADQQLRLVFPGVQNGTVLNRDTSGGNSNIAGTVTSDGRVLLINPNKNITIQPGALIDTDGGFLASTLDTPDDEALLAGGNTEFSGGGFLTGITNNGTIRSAGGDIILVGHSVINSSSGEILAPSGSVYIGAGTRIRLAAAGEPRITVLEGDPQHVVTNDGAIEASKLVHISAYAASPIAPPNRNPAIANNGLIRTTSLSGRVFLSALPGNSQVLNSSRGTIDSANLTIEGELINEGAIIDPDDGSNPSAPSGTRQFPRLTSSALADTASSDFRLSRLSFSHLNGLESKTQQKSKTTARKPAPSVAANTRATTITRGSNEDAKKKNTATGKKIVLRRGTFFGKKTD